MVWDARAWNNTVNFSPLTKAIDDYRTGTIEKARFDAKRRVGADIASGNIGAAMTSAADAGYEPSVLLTIGEKARQQEERQRMAQALQGAESNPELGRILTPEVRASIAALSPEQRAAKIAEYADPIKREQLNIQRQQAARTAADQYGKQGSVVTGPDGKFYSVQFGSNGQKIVEPLQFNGQALTPSKGVDTVGDTIIDKATGAPVRNVAPNIAGAAAAKEIGEAQGKATMDAPRVADNATQMLDTIRKAREHPGRSMGTGPVAGRLPAIGGDQAGFVALMNQIQGKTFLEAFNSLKGGGQITEAEGKKATDALARLDRVQNERDFNAALVDLEDVVKAGAARSQRAAQPAQGMGAPVPQQPRQVPVINSPAEASRLPSGTIFKTPDGRTMQVP